MRKNWIYHRGDIYYADLDPVCGSEQGGCRPVLVLQNNTGNRHAPTLIVAPISTRVCKKSNLPTHLPLFHNPAFRHPSMVMLEQIRTIDKIRIHSFAGKVYAADMLQIDKALNISLALNQSELQHPRAFYHSHSKHKRRR